jgi:hypothetical protein
VPLLGEFEPLVRQLFVAPLAFFVPATGRELSAFCGVRTQSFGPRVRGLTFQMIAGCYEIHRHGDLHHFPSRIQASAIRAFAL